MCLINCIQQGKYNEIIVTSEHPTPKASLHSDSDSELFIQTIYNNKIN